MPSFLWTHTMYTEPSTPNFPAKELRCKCPRCQGLQPNHCSPDALLKLQAIREEFGKPMALTSAYRCENHPEEAKKARPGQHTNGVAFDVLLPWGADRMKLLQLAVKHGAKGFGFANSFIHIDFRDATVATSWGYN